MHEKGAKSTGPRYLTTTVSADAVEDQSTTIANATTLTLRKRRAALGVVVVLFLLSCSELQLI